MPFRLSDRTSNSRALSTISRLVRSRVSLRALLIKLSSITMFVLPIRRTIHQFLLIRCMFRLAKVGWPPLNAEENILYPRLPRAPLDPSFYFCHPDRSGGILATFLRSSTVPLELIPHDGITCWRFHPLLHARIH